MAINLKSERADALARELSDLTGESLTEAITVALDQRLLRERELRRKPRRLAAMERIEEDYRNLPVLDDRSAEEILGYDDVGLPQ